MDDLTNSTPTSDTSATPGMEPESTQGTVQNSSDATQGAPVEEAFTSVDVKTLPPQLQAIYRNMEKDYKQKTTKLSETIKSESAKAAEAFKSKAELYDQIATQEEFVKQWNEYVQKSQSQTPEQNATDPMLKEMKAQLDEMNNKIQMNELSEVTDAFADAVNEKGDKLHPDFDVLNDMNIGELVNGDKKEPFSLLRAAIELAQGQNPQEKLVNGYKTAKALRDQIFEMGRKAGMGRVQQKIG